MSAALQSDNTLTATQHASQTAVWLFSRNTDLGVFLGSALASLVALWIGAQAGILYDDTPDWAWIPAVLLIDVAHVYSTAFRVYFDKAEWQRHKLLYLSVPLIGLAIGMALYSEGELVFWRTLAYIAVFHFVRQQYGWVMLYRAKAGERDRLGKWIDSTAIYMATLYPLIYWHTNLPRRFWWFMANDFSSLPQLLVKIVAPVYWLSLAAYAVHSLYRRFGKGEVNPGKDIIVITTAICWYVGIVAFNSDYAFTVTNVIIHGVPYLALIYFYARARLAQTNAGAFKLFTHGPALFLFLLWALAYVEELVWDRGVWHDRAWFFGENWEISSLKLILVPLLALPQVTHYVLDGFIWRRKNNPDFNLLAMKN